MSDSFHASSVCCKGPNLFGLANRRGFLRMGLAGFTSLSLPGLLRLRAHGGETNRERTAVIMVWKPGGCSHIDTYDPKPNSGSEYRGPFSTIPTKVPDCISPSYCRSKRVSRTSFAFCVRCVRRRLGIRRVRCRCSREIQRRETSLSPSTQIG